MINIPFIRVCDVIKLNFRKWAGLQFFSNWYIWSPMMSTWTLTHFYLAEIDLKALSRHLQWWIYQKYGVWRHKIASSKKHVHFDFCKNAFFHITTVLAKHLWWSHGCAVPCPVRYCYNNIPMDWRYDRLYILFTYHISFSSNFMNRSFSDRYRLL